MLPAKCRINQSARPRIHYHKNTSRHGCDTRCKLAAGKNRYQPKHSACFEKEPASGEICVSAAVCVCVRLSRALPGTNILCSTPATKHLGHTNPQLTQTLWSGLSCNDRFAGLWVCSKVRCRHRFSCSRPNKSAFALSIFR